MTIDATFWVAISFFIFVGGLIYLKIPQKINGSLNNQIDAIRKELDEAEKLKVEAKNLLSDYEKKIDRSKIKKKRKKKTVEEIILDIPATLIQIEDRQIGDRLADKEPSVNIKAPAYYMNNREYFINFIN